ncbi:hypothetical protein A2197_00015 [Candidatus Woesebacteria bacterium RIFOXYA1_FULL_48_16]|uniref:Uncharacterized protein n=1 Tax=Candidatus Woesebacteria bacterium RIFOXYA1_FULL_48_16 TaxID=1802535 RepID=A0A1F8CLI2_9BACT|nr:MAG: hypothetical protein A2197_00015 [Candidatus Woesebacteria bacterium RIFOXYA1_FULL_48_16]
MAEDEVKKEEREPLTDLERAKKSLENAIKKGAWSASEPQKEFNPQEEKEYPTKEEQEKKLSSAPFSLETIPPKIKMELTNKAKRLNTLAMGGEGSQESIETPKVPPFVDTRDEGVARFKQILRQGATPQETLERTPTPPAKKQSYPVPMSTRPPLPEEKPGEQIKSSPPKTQESFIKRFWNKLIGGG